MKLKAAALAGHGIPTIYIMYIYRTESDFVSPNCYGETTERCQCQCMRNEHALV